ncbi:MAG: primosomal protein N' [Aerococcaceae bacterium]|nr:primosomal protein N' [Aerococcaceae bacterium]
MFVKVIVDIPSKQVNRTFDYAVPEAWQSLIQLGMRVQVPFGKRQLLGFVVAIQDTLTYDGTIKPITSVLDYGSFLNEELLALSEHLAEELQVFRITLLQAMLPAMLKVKYHTVFVVEQPEHFPYGDEKVVHQADLEARLPKAAIKALLDQGIVRLEYRVEDQTTTKTMTYVQANQSPGQLQETLTSLGKKSPKLQQILRVLLAQPNERYTYAQLAELADVSTATIKSAIDKGILVKKIEEIYRNPDEHKAFHATKARVLTPTQHAAFEQIAASFQVEEPATFLLQGVTGSGKTEIYLQLMAQVRAQGKAAILLVPEIALTPQMVQQVKGRFQTGVAVLHSGLSTSEKYDEWRRIIAGEATIVVGARSSIFAPVKQLGLIIIDEEHETTYKQADTPRYHAREVALWRSRYHDCPLVLGSATPSLESRTRAEVGRYQLIRLNERVNQTPLPPIEIVDMTQQLVHQTHDELSTILQEKIAERLQRNEQIVLLLNRRGYASYMLCRECGFVFQCPRCDISLTYHKHEHRLKCHYCDFHQGVATNCPQCQSSYLRTFGLGTQKVAETLETLFPQAKIIRMDVDTTKRKGDHERLLNQFATGEANILLGTQMIAKGLDFEKVTLVGVINADTALNLPDFRSSEKTFQLLTQVAGRTGRGRFAGEVVIQTYNPDHYVMQFAKAHDYENFFYYELKRRHLGNYPPYYYTTLVTVSSKNQGAAYQAVYELKELLYDAELENQQQMLIIGPSRSAIAKMNESYYFQLLLKYKNKAVVQPRLNAVLNQTQAANQKGIYIAIDHEPLYFM